MQSLTSQVDKATTRVIIQGMPGSGKTDLAAELSKKYNLYWLDCENALENLKKLPPAQQERINYLNLPDSASYPIAADTVARIFRDRRVSICNAHSKVSCMACKKSGAPESILDLNTFTSKDILVLDSITQVGFSFLAHAMRDKPVDAKPERDDWGSLKKQTQSLVSQMQSARINIVAIAQCAEIELEDGKKKLVPDFGSSTMSGEVGKFFSHIIFTDVKNGKHVAFSSSTSSNTVLTRSRSDFKIEALATPSLIPLFDAVTEGSVTVDKPVIEKPPVPIATVASASTATEASVIPQSVSEALDKALASPSDPVATVTTVTTVKEELSQHTPAVSSAPVSYTPEELAKLTPAERLKAIIAAKKTQ